MYLHFTWYSFRSVSFVMRIPHIMQDWTMVYVK